MHPSGPAGPLPERPAGNFGLIQLLERKLAEAKAGTLVGVGLVSHTKDGIVNVDSIYADASPLIVGALQLQRQLLDKMFAQAPRPPSGGLPS